MACRERLFFMALGRLRLARYLYLILTALANPLKPFGESVFFEDLGI